jgi:ribonuclease HII
MRGTHSEGGRPRILGIDEAGRGSLLGPLVVGGFLAPADRLAELRGLGVRDSKLLTAARRAEIYRGLGRIGRRLAIHLAPTEIDRWVTRGRLNLLEAHAFARLVRSSRATEAYVDACDPIAARFGRLVAGIARTEARVVAQHRADRDVPVVAAASIVAKVQRDRAVARLRRELGVEFGSGYPSDPATVAFVRTVLSDRPATGPSWLRRSWESIERLKPPRPVRTLDGEWG